MWKIWLKGSNIYKPSDERSELDIITAFGTAVESPEWIDLNIEYMNPRELKLGEPITGNDGGLTNSYGALSKFTIRVEPFRFPADMEYLNDIEKMLRKRYIYICLDGEGQLEETKYPYRIHDVGKCIAVAFEPKEASQDLDKGAKILELELTRVKPMF